MLIVTIAALLMAASLAWFAYRLMQEEHRRSDARVAVLSAALQSEAPAFAPPAARAWAPAVRHGGINGTTPAAARPTPTPDIVMLEDDTRNVRAFRSEHDVPAPRGVDRADVLRAPVVDAPEGDAADAVRTRDSGLFAEVPAARRVDARGLVAVVAILLVAGLAVMYALFGRATDT
ncbi:MAG TPA: hypothetical protein VMF13_12940, partial [Luteitalea sp.]|nr:hypothetical protein [Luteitalea sp.]